MPLQLTDSESVQISETISLRARMVVMRHTTSYLKVRRNARLVWIKVVRFRQVGKERFFKSFQKTPYELIRAEKNREDLDHREPDMAVRHARSISVREELAGKSIL